jgi:hypothetical protein
VSRNNKLKIYNYLVSKQRRIMWSSLQRIQ